MATVAAVRAALVGALESITSVRWYDQYPGQIVAPAGVVRRQVYSYGITFDGDTDATYAVTVYVPLTEVLTAQALIDTLLSPSGGIYAAIETDPTLGGVVDYAIVTRATEDGLTSLSGIDHLSATVTVLVGGA